MEVGTLIEVDSLDSERLLALNSRTSFFPPPDTHDREGRVDEKIMDIMGGFGCGP